MSVRDSIEDDDERGFLSRYRVIVGVAVVALLGAGAWFVLGKKSAPKKKVAEVRMVEFIPPPPPPATPPPQEPPPEQPEPEDRPEFQPEEAPKEAPKEEPPPADEPPLGTNLTGDGPGNDFGLGAGGGMGVIGGKGKGGGNGGTKFGWYAAQVQTRVADAVRRHPKTRSAQMSITVRIWADANGRVTRATLADSTGNVEVDRALQDEILTGLQLTQPPPADMPMPIVMRISAKRPN